MKRIVFELIFIATTWYIFLPPLNLTSWEFLFFLCGHLLVVAILFGFGKGINLVKTVHVRHGKAEAALNLEGFKINRLGNPSSGHQFFQQYFYLRLEPYWCQS